MSFHPKWYVYLYNSVTVHNIQIYKDVKTYAHRKQDDWSAASDWFTAPTRLLVFCTGHLNNRTKCECVDEDRRVQETGWRFRHRHCFSPVFHLLYLYTLKVRQRLVDQKLMALPKEAAKFASLKASDTVCGTEWEERRVTSSFFLTWQMRQKTTLGWKWIHELSIIALSRQMFLLTYWLIHFFIQHSLTQVSLNLFKMNKKKLTKKKLQ